MYVQPTFDSVEKQYDDELVGDPGPGLARQATEFILSPFYTRSFDDVMDKPTAQQEALAGGLAPVPAPGPIWAYWTYWTDWTSWAWTCR